MTQSHMESVKVKRPTDELIEQAAAILDRYNEQLHREGAINTYALEIELREVWGLGYQALKPVMIDLMRNFPEYECLAAYYAEFGNQSMMGKLERPFYEESPSAMRVVAEFKKPLAELYGANSWHNDESLADKRRRYWIEAFEKLNVS